MITLPEPVHQVNVPEAFSVSQVVAANDCILKVLLPMQGGVIESLYSNPSAELGKVFHSLLEGAVKKVTGGEKITCGLLEELLDDLLEEARGSLEKTPHTALFANLPKTMTPLAWERKKRSLIDAAFEIAENQPQRVKLIHKKRSGSFSYEHTKVNGCWVEVPIHVPRLRIRGRVDVLERSGSKVKIIDLKSGRVENTDGKIMPKIALQLRLYGLMAKSLEPKDEISLAVNDGTEHSVEFEPSDVEEVKEWLSTIMGSLHAGKHISADEHSSVGPECRWCGFRHQCFRYIREAPSLWSSELDWPLPMDTWGTVEDIKSNISGLCDLTILDANGRRVKVFSVRQSQLTKLRIGDQIWLFGLSASRPALRGGGWRHPLNFHEVSDADITNRAWSLQIFGS